ncbi:hypothetical protein [Ferrovibrio sp.]|uniref:hypothetical protein n=1 Tax=Ferrovibrio sp. TaxID=1917215 RepID=UPI00262838B8|nr:hypothetical protein [Ferrovibrio sp.]
MDKLGGLSDFDIFAYLATGLAAMAACDLVFATHWVIGASWSLSEGLITLPLGYVLGHILAGPAGFLIERHLVPKLLGEPKRLLFAEQPQGGWPRRTLLLEYYTPLDDGLRRRVTERAAREHKPAEAGEALFWTAYAVAKRDELAFRRMEIFIKLYSFCRNIAFVAAMATVAFLGAAACLWWRQGWSDMVSGKLWLALLAAAIAFGMLIRYLKFLRLYTVEVFVAYSEPPPAK